MTETKKTVLVVDDDPDIVNIVKTLLEGEGYGVLCAYDGLEVFTRLEEQIPDVLIIDRVMPGMNGLAVISKLKESPKTSSIPVIMLTSMDKFDDVSEGYKIGANCHLAKPFTKAQILNGIKLVTASRPELSGEKLEAHAVAFLRACYKLSKQTEKLVGLFAAQDGLSPSAWLYRGLEARLQTDQVQLGNLKADSDWRYCFRGWEVDFQNTKTGEQAELAIGPGGRDDTFDEWRVQGYIENEAQRGTDFMDLHKVVKDHSDGAKKFMEHLSRQEWIEPARAKKGQGKKDYDAQLGDRWVVSNKGTKLLEPA